MLKKNALLGRLRQGGLFLLLCLPLFAVAAATEPQKVVQQAMDEVLGDLDAHKETYRKDSQALYQALNRILTPVVDVDGISRSVMTVKYSRGASPEQIRRFEENFERSLIEFYGNALLDYDKKNAIKVVSSRIDQGGRASVGVQITGDNGTVYPVTYTMVAAGDSWKVRNVIINGINIGKLFRDQFADAMNRNGNDLEKTINGWGAEVAKVKDSQAGQQAAGKK